MNSWAYTNHHFNGIGVVWVPIWTVFCDTKALLCHALCNSIKHTTLHSTRHILLSSVAFLSPFLPSPSILFFLISQPPISNFLSVIHSLRTPSVTYSLSSISIHHSLFFLLSLPLTPYPLPLSPTPFPPSSSLLPFAPSLPPLSVH